MDKNYQSGGGNTPEELEGMEVAIKTDFPELAQGTIKYKAEITVNGFPKTINEDSLAALKAAINASREGSEDFQIKSCTVSIINH